MKWFHFVLCALAVKATCQAESLGKYGQYGGITSLAGRGYFVTPEGHAFFSIGATHAEECARRDELNLFKTKYGTSEERLAEFFLQRFKEWGYNSSGYGPLPTMEKRIPYVATIWTEGPRSFSAGEKSDYADIFDPAVQERLRKRVREATVGHVDNRYCLGYVFIDLPVWYPMPKRGESYCNFIRSIDTAAPGRKAYDAFVTQRRTENRPFDDEAFLSAESPTPRRCSGFVPA